MPPVVPGNKCCGNGPRDWYNTTVMSSPPTSTHVVVKQTAEEATWVATEMVKQIICDAAGEDSICQLALAGGTTPHGLYLMLAGAALSGEVPWHNVEVFFGDERAVPQDHVESNYRMAQHSLLDHVPIEPQHIHPMPADADELDVAAATYEATVRSIVPPLADGQLPAFDLILLGMGGEGHVASLFPGTDVLDETEKLVTAYFVPVLGRSRMTFTFPLINAAKHIIFLVTGADKAHAVAALLSDDPAAADHLPAARVRPTHGEVSFVLDAAAARQAGLRPEGA